MKEKGFDTSEFVEHLKRVKEKFHIKRVKRTSVRSRRRITILARDEYLRLGGDIHQAFFLEADLYHLLRKVILGSDPTPQEKRLRELPRRRRPEGKSIDPLRLVSETYDPEDNIPCSLAEFVFNILTEEEQDGISGDNRRGRALKTFAHLQEDARPFTKQKRTSLYRAD